VRRCGWAEDDEEYEPGVRCIAAPIHDYRGEAIAAVSTSGPIGVITKKEVKRFAGYVTEAAAGISRRMGHRATDRRARSPLSER
jgi:DNA-binding IclR family transcriptional regulator